MSLSKIDFIYLGIIFIVSCILVSDLFLTPGRLATFDGAVHITQIAQFSAAIKDGDFPVAWLDGFANYGLPLGIFAQQLPTYLGAFFNTIVDNPVLSFNLVFFVGVFLSNIFYYYFLRIYFQPTYAFFGSFLFNLAPYRIIDVYIRGVTPEIFSMIFLPLILISIYYLVQKRSSNAIFLLIFSFVCLILTHPIMFVTYSFIYIPYFIFNLIKKDLDKGSSIFNKDSFKLILLFTLSLLMALGLTSYYILPLNIETKYLYFGSQNHFSLPSYMSLVNYFDPQWHYFYREDIFTRGHIIKSGIMEISIVIIGLMIIFYRVTKKKFIKSISILDFAVVMSIVIIFFTLKYSTFIYQNVNILSNIQHQWRMMSAFIFLPPIIIVCILEKINKRYVLILLVLLICWSRFPQIYGKNFTIFSEQSYYFTPINLHSVNMNTIWSGKSEDYPVKRNKIEIIKGSGNIESKKISNSSREYVVNAKTNLNIVDYTFYFPGWNVYVDNKLVPIQFQDPGYRGVITYLVPKGQHKIQIIFQDTIVRKIAKIISILSIGILTLFFLLRKTVLSKVYKYD